MHCLTIAFRVFKNSNRNPLPSQHIFREIRQNRFLVLELLIAETVWCFGVNA